MSLLNESSPFEEVRLIRWAIYSFFKSLLFLTWWSRCPFITRNWNLVGNVLSTGQSAEIRATGSAHMQMKVSRIISGAHSNT